MIAPWWEDIHDDSLAQGDRLPDCVVPIFVNPTATETVDVPTLRVNLIVVTQTCDLVNGKAEMVACCSLHTLPEFEQAHPIFKTKGRWEDVRKGREPSLHLLASPDAPNIARDALVVDFGNIVSLPIGYLTQHAPSLGPRKRLMSPYLEHFSQGLARFFMRVGLPSTIPPFK